MQTGRGKFVKIIFQEVGMLKNIIILFFVVHCASAQAKFYVGGMLGAYVSHQNFQESVVDLRIPQNIRHNTFKKNKKQLMYGATAGYIFPIESFFIAPEISIILADSSTSHTYSYTDSGGATSKTIKFNHMGLINVGSRFGVILDRAHLFVYLGGVHASGKCDVTRPGHNINYGTNVNYWSFSSGVGASYLLDNDYYVRVDYRYIARKKMSNKQVSKSENYAFYRRVDLYNQLIYLSFGMTL